MDSIILQTGDNTVTDGDVIGRLGFAASSETGTNARLVVAKIEAVAEEAFDASNNSTEMVFYLAADGAAASKMTLTSAGNLNIAGELQTANIGYTDGDNAMVIADGGKVTFAAGFVVGSDAAGDILYHNGTSYVRLGIGSDGQMLTVNDAANGVGWEAAAALATDAIVTANITDLNVTTAKIAADAITGAKIADDTIDSEHYAAGSIDNEHLADDAVDSDELAAGAVDLAHMSANSVDSDQYVDLSIDTAHIAADAITGAKIADDTIDSEHYAAASIDNEHLADDAVGTAEIADDAITSALIADDAIVSAAIADDAVLTAHIADDQITAALMADNSIDSDMYVDGSIDTAHIADAQVTLAKIANQAANTVLVRDANSSGVVSAKALTTTQILIGDGTGFTAAALSGDVTMTNAGVVSIADDVISSAELADACTAVTSFTAPLIEGSTSVQTPLIQYTDGDNAITIHDGGSVTFAKSINQAIANAEAEPENAVIDIDLRKGNYFEVTLGAAVTDIDFTHGTDGQRFVIRFEQAAGANYAMGASAGWNLVTHDQDGGGGTAPAVTIRWAGGTAPTMTATNAKADTYGFIIRDENKFDGYIIGQNV